jgi:hypothetical protein
MGNPRVQKYNHSIISLTPPLMNNGCSWFLQIVTEFEVKPDPAGGDVKPMTRTLLVPDRDVNLQFVDL